MATSAVDSLPFLNLIPETFAPFKQEAHKIFDETLALFRSHVDDVSFPIRVLVVDPARRRTDGGVYQVREAVAGGDDAHCFTKYILQQQETYQLSDNEATFLAGAMFGAGSDTTADGISTFLMTMVTHPEVQKKAQEELDRVVGRDRLPNFADQPDLVYIGAIVREMMRWRTIIAGGLAHCSTEDDEYNGEAGPSFFVPGESVLTRLVFRLFYPEGHRRSRQSLGDPHGPRESHALGCLSAHFF